MSRNRYKPKDIVAKLRQVQVLTTQGKTVGEAIRWIGITEVAYYRWRSEYRELNGFTQCVKINISSPDRVMPPNVEPCI